MVDVVGELVGRAAYLWSTLRLSCGDPAYLARNAKSMFRKRKATALESLTLTN
jgi:hypothetical protein